MSPQTEMFWRGFLLGILFREWLRGPWLGIEQLRAVWRNRGSSAGGNDAPVS